MSGESRSKGIAENALAIALFAWDSLRGGVTGMLGGEERARGVAGADAATVGASATELRHSLHITNTDIGLLVTVTALVGAVATLPFGVLADPVRRTTTLGLVIFF